MTPAARVQAAIEILDEFLSGAPVEKALTGWARRSRFAGSKDRAAIRDHVFDAVRCMRSYAARGGAMTGRGLMLGALRAAGEEPDDFFSGDRHAPAPVQDNEIGRAFATVAEEHDIPEWLWPIFERSLGDLARPTAVALQQRAPVHLRVNLARADVETAVAALRSDGIEVVPHPACATALEVVSGARRVSNGLAYARGLVELQDAASQAVVAELNLKPGMRVLDFCAGGGGKALGRAGISVTPLASHEVAQHRPFDLVLVDAPCSGSGSWRRAPAGKWALTPDRLTKLSGIQDSILDQVAPLVTGQGVLAYATCSLLDVENDRRVDRFLAEHADWTCGFRKLWQVAHGTDGFFTAHLTR